MEKEQAPLKSQVVFNFYKISNFCARNKKLKLIGFPVRILYKFLIDWILGIDIPDTVISNGKFIIFHGQGLVLHPKTQLGKNVILRQNTTIGNSKNDGLPPKIGDFVDIGANCVIIGNITIGNNVTIGAGAVVIKDIPDNAIVVGNPAKIIKFKAPINSSMDN